MELPEGFPLDPIDAHGMPLLLGKQVIVLTVESCARGLSQEDQDRLLSIVGQTRTVVDFDRFGFAWLSFSASEPGADFCLLPSELAVK
jgi:hypothetical protein